MAIIEARLKLFGRFQAQSKYDFAVIAVTFRVF